MTTLRTQSIDHATTDGAEIAVATRRRLLAGAAGGPLFLVLGYAQAFSRDGFHLAEHPFSFLAIGEHGWIQTANFLVCGVLFVLGATGLARAVTEGPGHRWGPRLFGLMGVGCLLGGLFEADPAFGFPAGIGAPEGLAPELSWHGLLHGPAFAIAIIGWVGAAIAFARWFRARGERGWATYSLVAGLALLAGGPFMGTGAGVVLLYITATFGWVWTTALCLHLRRLA